MGKDLIFPSLPVSCCAKITSMIRPSAKSLGLSARFFRTVANGETVANLRQALREDPDATCATVMNGETPELVRRFLNSEQQSGFWATSKRAASEDCSDRGRALNFGGADGRRLTIDG